MASNHNGSAYDLSLFESAEKRRPEQEPSGPWLFTSDRTVPLTKKQIRAERKKKLFLVIEFVVVAALCTAMVAPTILYRIKVNELNDQFAVVSKQLGEAKSENTRLEMELKSKISLTNVQDYAENVLGMVKRDRYQIYYFDIETGNEILPAQ